MTAQSGDIARAGSTPWALAHPGLAALVSAIVAIAGFAMLLAGLAGRVSGGEAGLLGDLWNALLAVVGAATFVTALPASLGFCGASCATQRELWPGLFGGLVTVLTTLAVVGMVIPVHGIA